MIETMPAPGLTDVLAAKQRIAGYLPRTPLINYPAIDQVTGTRTFIKHENVQPVGAFKVRGGINLISQLSEQERAAGVIAASTGNQGQSVAYAANLFGVRAVIVVPENANPLKVASMRNLGAEVIARGADFDEARVQCELISREQGLRYVHSGDEPLLIAGVGTITLEILEDAPQIDTIIVPVGGGSGAAAACVVASAINPNIKVIAVGAERAPAACNSWRARRLVEDKTDTGAEGLATRTAFALPQSIMWQHLDDFIQVSEEEIRLAIRLLIEKAHTLAEGAGAASLAAALKIRARLVGRNVALVLTGGNITLDQLRSALAEPSE